MATLYKPPAGTKVTDTKTGQVITASGSASYNTKLFTFSDGGGGASSSSSSSPAPTAPSTPAPAQPAAPSAPGVFYIESGTGAQVTAAQMKPGVSYTESGTGKTVVGGGGSAKTTAPATPTATAPKTTAPAATTPTSTQTAAQPTAQAPGLVMPASGSVVDLLNMAGQDSSFAARAQLAQQYGIQNYQGTAAQNTELSKKYLEAYNKLKSTSVPQTAAEARGALADFDEEQDGSQIDPAQQFMDIYSSMNPVEATIYKQLSDLVSSTNTQTSLREEYEKAVAEQGIPELQIELADINRIMDGTEDDIRAEVTNAGGFATESQVQALVGARNKVLLRKATFLQDSINAKNDYVDRIVSLTQADRQAVNEDLDRKLGITKMMFDITQTMQNNARQNWQNIVNQVGYGGLAQMVAGNPSQAKAVERALGLTAGDIYSLAAYKKPLTEMEALELENKKLQNSKLRADIAKMSAAQMTTSQKLLALSMQQSTIGDTETLLKAPGLNSAVGPNPLARIAVADAFGAKSNFIAGVEQLRQQLTLDKLVSAKGSGATFGALSDAELQLLAASASKLGTWAVKDSAGNITGYSASESDFKRELDKINSFQKLDYILKGGSPSSVGVTQMNDGTFWTKNSDGTFTKL